MLVDPEASPVEKESVGWSKGRLLMKGEMSTPVTARPSSADCGHPSKVNSLFRYDGWILSGLCTAQPHPIAIQHSESQAKRGGREPSVSNGAVRDRGTSGHLSGWPLRWGRRLPTLAHRLAPVCMKQQGSLSLSHFCLQALDVSPVPSCSLVSFCRSLPVSFITRTCKLL